MDLSRVVVTVESGRRLGGVYPFVVACYDNDLSHELYKTSATRGNDVSRWGETFEVDLHTEDKARVAAHQNPPTYLTFFIYDTGKPGVPPLGSAGVLLDTVRQSGLAQGDFPVVNGQRDATLALVASAAGNTGSTEGPGLMGKIGNMIGIHHGQSGATTTAPAATAGGATTTAGAGASDVPWYKTKTAKAAAGAVGAGAVLAGVTAMAVGKKNKNKKKKEQEELQRRASNTNQRDDDDLDRDNNVGRLGPRRDIRPTTTTNAPLYYPSELGDPGDDDDVVVIPGVDAIHRDAANRRAASDDGVDVHIDNHRPGATL